MLQNILSLIGRVNASNHDCAVIDFETRSQLDIRAYGSYKYATDPTTQPICLAYLLPGDLQASLWNPGFPRAFIRQSPPPVRLFEHIARGGKVEAHNAMFDRCIWQFVMMRIYDWPEIQPEQWRCSAAKAAAAALPRKLSEANKALKLPALKDEEGQAVMLKLCKPRPPRKDEPKNKVAFREDRDLLLKCFEYCIDDVIASRALSYALPDLPPDELKIWQIDQQSNMYGTKFDLDFARAAIQLSTDNTSAINRRIKELTGIARATLREQLRKWLADNEDLALPDMQADTLKPYLQDPNISLRAKEVLELTIDGNRTSVKKYHSIIHHCDDDGVARDLIVYHGASTGRYAGKLIQTQNLRSRALIFKDINDAVMDIMTGNLSHCQTKYDNVSRLVSDAIRGAIVPREGCKLAVADYSAIEARVLMWLIGDHKATQMFFDQDAGRGADIYCDMASTIYRHQVTKKDNPDKRQFGKQAILGLGYGMGFSKFLITCRGYGIRFTVEQCANVFDGHYHLNNAIRAIKDFLHPKKEADDTTETYQLRQLMGRKTYGGLLKAKINPKECMHELALMRHTVMKYRNKYELVPQFWKNVEKAVVEVIRNKQKTEHIAKVKIFYEKPFLCIQLPSGRCLRYLDPFLKNEKTAFGEKPSIRFTGISSVTKKADIEHTYGGKLTENIVQAIARDIMCYAIIRLHERTNYKVLLSTHDEIISEIPIKQGDIDQYQNILTEIEPWMQGCPVAAEGALLDRYAKL